jgi:outer membrane protein
MKNLPLILNGILIAAVAFLFTKVYSKNGSTSNKINTSTKDSSGMGTSCKIAYVELDSLNEQILFIKNKKTELEGEQQAIENEFREGYKRLQNISADFQKRAQAQGAAVNQREAEEMQNRLMQEQQQLNNVKETKSQQLSEKSYKFLEDIQKKLKEFLLTYNKDKKYQYILTTGGGTEYMLYKDESLNITDLVVKEMNLILSK